MKITKKMTIAQVVGKFPDTIPVFMKYHMMCFGCGIAHVETIEEGCKGHGINLEEFLKELNEAVKN